MSWTHKGLHLLFDVSKLSLIYFLITVVDKSEVQIYRRMFQVEKANWIQPESAAPSAGWLLSLSEEFIGFIWCRCHSCKVVELSTALQPPHSTHAFEFTSPPSQKCLRWHLGQKVWNTSVFFPGKCVITVRLCLQEMVDWFNAIRAARFHYLQVAFPGANDEEVRRTWGLSRSLLSGKPEMILLQLWRPF